MFKSGFSSRICSFTRTEVENMKWIRNLNSELFTTEEVTRLTAEMTCFYCVSFLPRQFYSVVSDKSVLTNINIISTSYELGLTLTCFPIRSECESFSAFTHTRMFCVHGLLFTAVFPISTMVYLCRKQSRSKYWENEANLDCSPVGPMESIHHHWGL